MNDHLLEEFFMGIFLFGSRIEEKYIIRLAENKIAGNEVAYCTYEKDDEDYKEGYVSVLLFEPFTDKDVVLHIENKAFFDSLVDFIGKYDTNKEKLAHMEKYLIKIKKDLNIDIE